jgi:peptide chain release factor 2
MIDYEVLESVDKLVNARRDELEGLLRKQESDYNNVSLNKKIKGLMNFIAEYDALNIESEEEFNKFYVKTLLTGKYDGCDCVLNISAGAGGTEAQDWAEMVMRMQTRFAEIEGYDYEITAVEAGDGAGIKGASILVTGLNAYGVFKSEAGVHRLVRISPYDANKRRHTSFCAVEVVPQIEKTELAVPDSDLRIDTLRANGAGGQHINKTESAVRITHLPTGIACIGQTCRSQLQNKEFAMKNLLSKLEYLHYENEQRKLKNLQPIQMKIEWGSQIRSYVLCPYTMAKDHRTGAETSNVQKVLDGDLKMFSDAFLLGQKDDEHGVKS